MQQRISSAAYLCIPCDFLFLIKNYRAKLTRLPACLILLLLLLQRCALCGLRRKARYLFRTPFDWSRQFSFVVSIKLGCFCNSSNFCMLLLQQLLPLWHLLLLLPLQFLLLLLACLHRLPRLLFQPRLLVLSKTASNLASCATPRREYIPHTHA